MEKKKKKNLLKPKVAPRESSGRRARRKSATICTLRARVYHETRNENGDDGEEGRGKAVPSPATRERPTKPAEILRILQPRGAWKGRGGENLILPPRFGVNRTNALCHLEARRGTRVTDGRIICAPVTVQRMLLYDESNYANRAPRHTRHSSFARK